MGRPSRTGRFLKPCLSLVFAAAVTATEPWAEAAKFRIQTHGSSKNRDRPVRRQTRYIVLHTTEGAERGALLKLARDGEAHYLVGRTGQVYRIVDRRKVAFHAGVSMWNGATNIDKMSLAVEVVGYHHQRPKPAQLRALKELLRQLKHIYNIPDDRVLTHSMVAYGTPNRWHKHRHRGRKRCAMALAHPDVRKAMGLDRRPKKDPDVAAGRLAVADEVLFRTLFPAKGQNRPVPVTAKPAASKNRGYLTIEGKQVALKKGVRKSKTTIFLFPDGMVRTGAELVDDRAFRSRLEAPPKGTRVLVGYAFGGYVKAHRPPSVICGEDWNEPSTFYRFPDGSIHTGDRISANRIPQNTLVFFKV